MSIHGVVTLGINRLYFSQANFVFARFAAGMWFFFALIMISSYTANLAAFLTVETLERPIESAEDLANQDVIKYGALNGGSTAGFFENSNLDTYQRLWQFMSGTCGRLCQVYLQLRK